MSTMPRDPQKAGINEFDGFVRRAIERENNFLLGGFEVASQKTIQGRWQAPIQRCSDHARVLANLSMERARYLWRRA